MNVTESNNSSPPLPPIECGSRSMILDHSSRIDAPVVFRQSQQLLVDYSAGRASLKDEESAKYQLRQIVRKSSPDHDNKKRMECLKHRREQQAAAAAAQTTPSNFRPVAGCKTSMIDLFHTSATSADGSTGSHGDDSDVVFYMRVPKPGLLIRRRHPLQAAKLNRTTKPHQKPKLKREESIQSFAEETVCSQSLAPATLEGHDQDQVEDDDVLHPSIRSIPVSELPLPLAAAMAGSTSTLKNYASAADVSNQQASCNPLQDSYLHLFSASSSSTSHNLPITSTVAPIPKRPVNLRKRRKSMVNWLANRIATKDLMAPRCANPSPPMFIKVIYLPPDDSSEEDNNHNSNNDDKEANNASQLLLNKKLVEGTVGAASSSTHSRSLSAMLRQQVKVVSTDRKSVV